MSESLRNRIIIFLVVLVVAVLFILPTFFRDQLGAGWISRPISLGLDLSGGAHLVYEVKAAEAVKSRLQTLAFSVRAKLRDEKVALLRSAVNAENQLQLVLLSERSIDQAKSIIEKEFRELTYIDKVAESSQAALLYGISEIQAKRVEQEAINQAVETLRNRVDQFGVAEPLIQKVGTSRILLQMPGIQDIESVKKVVGSVAKLEFRLVPQSGAGSNTVSLKNREGAQVVVEDQALMTGDAVDDARVNMYQGQVDVTLKLTTDGTKTFRRITSENVGRQLAIILDNIVYSSPVIREAIPGGSANISGGFTMVEARQLAVVLRAGALPAPLEVMEERTVGPTLGKESIEKGVLAMLIGFAAIITFMVIYYKKSGAVAVATLAVNVVLVIACLSAFGATLTLPGLAGVALTIGMAVDSNVIIFERIREEIRNGATRDVAVSAGFDKALTAILDSNITTLLSGLILLYFGTGPIRGFAVTLCIGIVTTIYCATFCSKLGFDLFPMRSDKTLSI